MYKIIKKEEIAPKIILLEVEAPRVAASALPGEFVIVRMDEKGERIPLTICDYDADKGTVTIVVQVIGASTSKMAVLEAGDYFQNFVGPLGNASEFVHEDLDKLKNM
ncbi:MAG: oxidoreductase, NAD/FAD-binding, partial [Clostridiales bacterium]|nr:oxidoreductase, NAD/FAD-binding [Clostridiales bacterium]